MTPTSTNPSRDLGMKIRKLAFLMDRIAGETLRAQADLTFSEFRLLRMLMHSGGMSQKALASFHGLTDAAVSRKVDGLVRRKLLIRAVNPSNRREHVLMLTPAGRLKADKAKAILGTKFDKLFDVLSAVKTRELLASLDTLLDAIWEEHGKLMCGRKRSHGEKNV